MKANNYKQAMSELDSLNIDLKISDEINELDKEHYHVVAIRSRANLKKNKFEHVKKTIKLDRVAFEKTIKTIQSNHSAVVILHNPLFGSEPSFGLGVETKPSESDLPKAAELIESIKTMEDVEALGLIVETETRKTVREAAEKRLEELAEQA
jgi:hypothetical protein